MTATTTATLNTVFIDPEMLGDIATDADVTKMIELLREKGWDAQAGNTPNRFDDVRQEYFDRDFAECLEQCA